MSAPCWPAPTTTKSPLASAHGIVVRTMGELAAALAEAKEVAAKGKPGLVNVWLDKTQFREGSLSM